MAAGHAGKCIGGPLDGKRKGHIGDSFEVAEYPEMRPTFSNELMSAKIEVVRHRYTWSGAWWTYNG